MSPMGLGAAPHLLLALLCLAPLTAAPPPPTAPTSLPGPPGTAPGPPAPRSEAPVLSLNLGLNFKIKVRSQGNPRPAAPSAPPAPPYPLPPGTTGTPVPPTLLPSGLGWPDSRDEPGSGVPLEEVGGWGGPPLRASTTPPASLAGEQDKELELDIAIDLTAGLEPEVGPGGAVPPTSLLWAHPSPRRPIPLIPGIKAGISELASKLSAAGFLVPTAPPRVGHEVPGGNGSQEQDQAGSGAEPAHPPGRQPPRGTVPPSAAASACTQGSTCGSGGPDPQGAPTTPLSWPPHFVALQTSWSVATATWGPAWEAHIYGIGCLFALLGLLGIVVLLGGPCSRPPAARLLGGLLAAAGAARAFPLFFDAYEQHGRLPPTAARLLFELPFPCLGWGLVLALRSPSRCRTPAVVALGVLHVAGVLGTVLAVAMLGRLPGLLLLPRGLFAGLVAALTLWVLPCCGGGGRGGGAQGKVRGAGGLGAGVAVGVAALGAVLSAGLQVFGALQVLGWGGPPPPGPWAWWGLQLGCRLAEATMGLPLAVLALVVAPPPRQSPAEPPNGCALRPRGDTEALPLCGDHPEPPEADGDPTAGYRPPSPIDLRRSIDEALGARPGIFRHGTVAGISVIGTVGIGTDGTAGSSATSMAGIGTTGLPGIGTTSTAGLSTTATPSLGTTSTEGLTTTSVTGLCTAGTPGMGTASMAGISATNASGFGTTTTPSPNTTSTAGCTTTGTPGLSTTSTLELSTTSTPSLGTDSTPALSTTTVPGPSAAGTAGLGTTATPDLSTTSTSGLGTASTREPSTTSTPRLTPAGRPRPLQRAASLGGWSVMSPGARGRRGGGSPSAQGLSQGGLAAVPDPSPTRRGPPRAAPVLRPSQSWAGGSPCPPAAPRPQGGHPGGGVPAAGGVPERPGDSSSNRHSLGSDTIDL